MKRPIVFALEILAALSLATLGGWIADRLNRSKNRQAQAMERVANAAERISDALDRAYPPLPRPSLLAESSQENKDGKNISCLDSIGVAQVCRD